MMAMIIISIVLAVLFIGTAIALKKQVPESISSLEYVYPHGLWTIWLWCVTILITPSLMDAIQEDWKFLGFLTVVCLMFVGAMPLIPTESNKVHNILGVTAGILSQLCVLIINPQWLWLWAVWAVVFVIKTLDKSLSEWKWSVFLAETVCFTSLIGSIIK